MVERVRSEGWGRRNGRGRTGRSGPIGRVTLGVCLLLLLVACGSDSGSSASTDDAMSNQISADAAGGDASHQDDLGTADVEMTAEVGQPDASAPDTQTDLGCVPQCDGLDCGPDGCGGTCGTCAAGDACNDTGLCEPTTPACGASETTGTQVGDTLAEVVLNDCDGNPVSLYSLCGNEASFVFSFAGWCPPCRAVAKNTLEQRWQAMSGDPGYGQVLVIAQDDSGNPPSSTYCKSISTQYGFTFPVLYDPSGALGGALGYGNSSNDQSTVLSEGMVIEFRGKYADQSAVGNVIDTLLAE